MDRRAFLQVATATYVGGSLLFSSGGGTGLAQSKPISPEPLQFAESDLEPVISAKTFSFHHGKHYLGYVDKANELLASNPQFGKTAEEIIRNTFDKPDQSAIFNNVSQAWNHAFFWKCLKPKSGKPSGVVSKMIDASFGDFEKFRDAFVNAAKAQFGSGWIWLVVENGELKIEKTSNADSPLSHGKEPIFTVDVWEHAYYLDYQNRRADFVKAVLEGASNWDFVNSKLDTK